MYIVATPLCSTSGDAVGCNHSLVAKLKVMKMIQWSVWSLLPAASPRFIVPFCHLQLVQCPHSSTVPPALWMYCEDCRLTCPN